MYVPQFQELCFLSHYVDIWWYFKSFSPPNFLSFSSFFKCQTYLSPLLYHIQVKLTFSVLSMYQSWILNFWRPKRLISKLTLWSFHLCGIAFYLQQGGQGDETLINFARLNHLTFCSKCKSALVVICEISQA